MLYIKRKILSTATKNGLITIRDRNNLKFDLPYSLLYLRVIKVLILIGYLFFCLIGTMLSSLMKNDIYRVIIIRALIK